MKKKKKVLITLGVIFLSPIAWWLIFGGGRYLICREFMMLRASNVSEGKEAAQGRCSAPYKGGYQLKYEDLVRPVEDK